MEGIWWGVGRDRDGTEGWGSERIGVGFEHTPVRIGLLLRIQVSPGWGRFYQRFKGYLVIINQIIIYRGDLYGGYLFKLHNHCVLL